MCVWPQLLPRDVCVLKRVLVDVCRPLLGEQQVDHRIPDSEVISRLCVLHPARLLTLMRVHTAIRVAARAPIQVVALLFEARDARKSWLSVLDADLQHLSQANCLEELRGSSLAGWFRFFRSNPSAARRIVMKACWETNWVTAEERDNETEMSTYCLVCGEPARDKQALSVHMFRSHGVRRYIRAFVYGAEYHDCLICGLRFTSRQRLVDHLSEKSPLCAHNYILRYEPLSSEETHAIDVAARSDPPRRQRQEGAHGVRTHGPFLLVFDLTSTPIRSRHPLGPNRRWQG